MKARYFVLASGLFLIAAAGVGIGLRHANASAPVYLEETVKPADIEASVTAMGSVDFDGSTIRAAITEGEISKIRIGQSAYFTRVGSPNQRFLGKVVSITAMPSLAGEPEVGTPEAIATPVAAASADDAEENPDTAGDPGVTKDGQVPKDPFAQPKTGVFYNVVFAISPSNPINGGGSLLVHVVQGTVKQVPAISKLALQKQVAANRYSVEVIGADGKMTARQIDTGLSDDLAIQVTGGLKLGEVVAIRDDGSLFDPGYRG